MGNRKGKNKTDKAKKKIQSLREEIYDLLRQYPSRAFGEKQIIRMLNIKHKHLRNNVDGILLELLRQEKIQLSADGRFTFSKSGNDC